MFISKISKAVLDEIIVKYDMDPKEDHTKIDEAQAKLVELENYLENMNLKRQKWDDYISQARKMAAVGDPTFDSTPPLDQSDVEYLNEKNRKKTLQGEGLQ